MNIANSIDINAPIIPNYSIGNIRLGENIDEYLNSIDEANYKLIDKFDDGQEYQLNGVPILIFVDDNSRAIFKLSAINGYMGKYNDVIHIGIKARDVLSKNLGFIYDDFYEGLVKDDGSILLEFSHDIPWDKKTDILNLEIMYITIFDQSKLLF